MGERGWRVLAADGRGGDDGEGTVIEVAIIVLSIVVVLLCVFCLFYYNPKEDHDDRGQKIINRIRTKRFKPAKKLVRVRPREELQARYNPAQGHWGFRTAVVQPSKVTSLAGATIDGVALSPMDKRRRRERERRQDEMYARRARGGASPNNRVVQGVYGAAVAGRRIEHGSSDECLTGRWCFHSELTQMANFPVDVHRQLLSEIVDFVLCALRREKKTIWCPCTHYGAN